MKYRLKNRELQAKLEAIEPKFGEVLSGYFGNRSDKTCIALYLCNGIDMTLFIRNSAIEEVPEDDHKEWTKWPYEEPTVDGYYRVEYKHNLQVVKDVWVWLDGSWVRDFSNFPSAWKPDFQDVRFKPWDDEEE